MWFFRRKEYAILGVSALCGLSAFAALQSPEPAVTVLVARRHLDPGEAFDTDPAEMVEVVRRPLDSLPPGEFLASLDQLQGRAVTIPVLKGEPIAAAKLGPDRVEALAAARALDYGEQFGADDMVRTVLIPRRSLPPGAVTSFQDIKGQWVHEPFRTGDLIVREKLTANPDYSLNLPPDTRAVTIGVDPISGASGFIQPGSHVDVLLSRKDQPRAELILQDVIVLAVNVTTRPAPSQVPINAKMVLLAVRPSQAQVLVGGGALGTLTLMLRNPNDQLVPVEWPPVQFLKIRTMRGTRSGEDHVPASAWPAPEAREMASPAPTSDRPRLAPPQPTTALLR